MAGKKLRVKDLGDLGGLNQCFNPCVGRNQLVKRDAAPAGIHGDTLHQGVRRFPAHPFVDQGLRLTYAFNHAEAIRAYREAARIDPDCSMCYWGIALAYGPNINLPMDSAGGAAAYQAIQQAVRLRDHASEAERAYIDALARRYGPPTADRAARDSAYAAAMGDVARRYPEDADAATLYGDAMMNLRPWNYWTSDGRPQPGTADIVAALEHAIARDSTNPGACHLYIHAVESSPDPSRAVPCAERLASLMPGAGHLVHMPAHIYMVLGRYADAITANEHAVHTDEVYLGGQRPQSFYPMMYYPHNIHFLSVASSFDGKSAEAIRSARQLVTKVPLEALRDAPPLEMFLPIPLLALVRFGRWEEILAEPAPDSSLLYWRGIRHYARGVAFAATNRPAEAAGEYDSLAALAGSMPPDAMVGINASRTVLTLAQHALAGELASRRGRTAEAVRHFEEALRIEDGLTYDEPPAWPNPVRQSLGAVLLEARRAADAERVYREDLRRHPENGWSLFGLKASLSAQGKTAAADSVDQRFRRAWARADVTLTASRF